MHLCSVAWRKEGFPAFFSSLCQAAAGNRLIFCCPRGEAEGNSEAAKGSGAVFMAPQACLLYDLAEGNETIGRCRNLLLLASLALGKEEAAVFFDDDVFPSEGTARAFGNALGRFDLVQGKYFGDCGNSAYLAVEFFGCLDRFSETGGAEELASAARALCGKSPPSGAGAAPGLQGAAGGILGVGAALKGRNCFAPTKFRFEDHYFEFSGRLSLRGLRFMGEGVAEELIPSALHDKPAGSEGALVSGYLLDLRSAIVEKYFYFAEAGALPMLVNGRHALVRAAAFDPQEIARQTALECALPKMQAAAAHYLEMDLSQPIRSQLGRLAAISEADYSVGMGELEAELAAFRKERESFLAAAKRIAGDQKGAEKELLGNTVVA